MLSKMQKYCRTKESIPTIIFNTQKRCSKERGHNPPEYTREELKLWMYSQDIFHKLYDEWIESGYKKDNKPSCDRLNNDIGYSFDNIEIVTWGTNKKRADIDIRNCLITHGVNPQKRVIQYSKDKSTVVDIFKSSQDAARQTGCLQSKISLVCNGKRNHTGGYYWKYEEIAV